MSLRKNWLQKLRLKIKREIELKKMDVVVCSFAYYYAIINDEFILYEER